MAHSGARQYRLLHAEKDGTQKLVVHPDYPNLNVRIVNGITAPLCREIPRVPGDVSAQACHAAPVIVFRMTKSGQIDYAIDDSDPEIPHCVFCTLTRFV